MFFPCVPVSCCCWLIPSRLCRCEGPCQDWFHPECVGLNMLQARAIDVYICSQCKIKKKGWDPKKPPTNKVIPSRGYNFTHTEPVTSDEETEDDDAYATSDDEIWQSQRFANTSRMSMRPRYGQNDKTEKIDRGAFELLVKGQSQGVVLRCAVLYFVVLRCVVLCCAPAVAVTWMLV